MFRLQIIKMHVSGSEENVMQFIALVLKLLMKKYRQSVRSAVCYFAVNIPLFFQNGIHFRRRSRPVFLRLRLRLRANCFGGSDSSSDKNVSAPASPAPAPHP